MSPGGLYGRLDDFAVRLGGEGACAAGAAGSGGAADAVEVDGVGLGGFVVEDDVDVGDVEAAGGEVCGEEVGVEPGAEGLYCFYALVCGVSRVYLMIRIE